MVETSHEVALTSKSEKADSRVAPHQAPPRSQEEKSMTRARAQPLLLSKARSLGRRRRFIRRAPDNYSTTLPLFFSLRLAKSLTTWSLVTSVTILVPQSSVHPAQRQRGCACGGGVGSVGPGASFKFKFKFKFKCLIIILRRFSSLPCALGSGALLASRAHEH